MESPDIRRRYSPSFEADHEDAEAREMLDSASSYLRDEVLTVANGITSLRLAAIPKLYREVRDNPQRVWWKLGLFAATDKLDGIAARALDQESELGYKLDHGGDKVFGAAMMIAGMQAESIHTSDSVVPKKLGAIALTQKAVTSAITLHSTFGPDKYEPEVTKTGKSGEVCGRFVRQRRLDPLGRARAVEPRVP